MSLLLVWFISIVHAAPPAPAPPSPPATSLNTTGGMVSQASPPSAPEIPVALSGPEIFKRAQALVFKLDTRLKRSNAEREHGSAFVVDVGGLLVTNYHVVADFIAEPETYELVLKVDGQDQLARVVAIDPVNDIAVVRVDRTFSAALPTELVRPPVIGDPLYSLGFPRSEDLALTQGTFNGERLRGFAPVVALSMALNHGMSGGPCFDQFGHVYGVNRAIHTEAQNISYLSPNAALNEAIARARATPNPPKNFSAELSRAVHEREAWARANQKPPERQRLGDYAFTAPLPGVPCGQDSQAGSQGKEYFICRSESLALLSAEQEALKVTLVALRSNTKYKTDSAFQVLQPAYALAKQPRPERRSAGSGGRRPAAAPKLEEHCNVRFVKNARSVGMFVRFCAVEIPRVSGLYNTFVKIDLDDQQTSFAESFQGMSLKTSGTMVEHLVESIQRAR